jgi:DNA polymerase III subunit delta
VPEFKPGVCIAYGDEFRIAEFIKRIYAELGDPATADINTSRLDGRSNSLEELESAARIMPFLGTQRLVVFSRPLDRIGRDEPKRQRLFKLLGNVSPATMLVLAHEGSLTDERDRKRNRLHWLEKWALEHPDVARLQPLLMPVGRELVEWISQKAVHYEGRFTPKAANDLAVQVGPYLRLLDQEIQKLLAYVNYSRPVDDQDVQDMTPPTARPEDFALVNALRDRNGSRAMQVLRKELEEEEPVAIFGQIVSQFRVLIQAREALQNKMREDEAARIIDVHPYRLHLAIDHARRFSMADLESIYHRLLETDIAQKTGGMEGELALEVLVTQLTQ